MISNHLFDWLVDASLVATALALLVLCVRPAAARYVGARAAVLLWAVPAIRLIMPPLPQTAAPVAASTPAAAPTTAAPAIDLAAFVGASPLPVAEPQSASLIQAIAQWPWATFALMAWALGAAVYVGRIGLSTLTFYRATTAQGAAPSPALQAQLIDVATDVGLKTTPRALVTPMVDTPQVIGLFRPLILLPTDFTQSFNVAEQRLALLHEAIHIRRGDLVAAWTGCALVAMQWFNPLAHAALKVFRLDQEAACDEAVRALGVPSQAYAGTLMKAVRRQQPMAVPALTLNHGLAHRIRHMARPLPASQHVRLATVAISVSAIACAAATAGTFTVQPPTEDEVDQALEGAPTDEDTKVVTRSRSVSRSVIRTDKDDNGEMTINVTREKKRDGEPVVVVEVQSGATMVGTGDGDTQYAFAFATDQGQNERVIVNTWVGGDQNFILASDPFSDIAMPPMPVAVGPTPPTPPSPPSPPAAIAGAAVPTPPEPPAVEGGQWVFIPDPPDMSEFEAEMKVFELKMKDFEVDMSGFETEMAAFGEKMGEVGEAVGELAEACAEHQERRNSLKVVSVDHPYDSRDIYAVCIPTGDDRPGTDEIRAFVDKQRRLNDDEKARVRNALASR